METIIIAAISNDGFDDDDDDHVNCTLSGGVGVVGVLRLWNKYHYDAFLLNVSHPLHTFIHFCAHFYNIECDKTFPYCPLENRAT